MGTRNLTKVIDSNGVTKVAQYGQWDGYPSGQGLTALYHAHNARMIESKLKICKFFSQEHLDWVFENAQGKDFSFEYPTLTRDTGADILGYIAYAIPSDGEIMLSDNSEFENDELFCEGVYTLDFQNKAFISKYGDKVVSFPLDNLPTNEEYLNAWKE